MVGFESDGFGHRRFPRFERLPLGSINQIQVDVVEAGLPPRMERRPSRVRGMQPLEGPKD
jgi:hypothetical protein